MRVRDEIPVRGDKPPVQMGESGTALRRFAGTLDSASAREMIRAIEDECERVDADEW